MATSTRVGALLLSGGRSERFGGSPKAMLPVAGEPAIRRMATRCLELEFSPVVVVIRPDAFPIARALEGMPVDVVASERCALGRTASIDEGNALVPPETDLLLWPVDHPFVHDMTLRALARAGSADAMGVWFVPTFDGRGGHPVWLKPPARRALSDLAADEPLRRLRDRLGPQVVRVPVRDPAVVWDIDTPEQYWAAQRQEERWTDG